MSGENFHVHVQGPSEDEREEPFQVLTNNLNGRSNLWILFSFFLEILNLRFKKKISKE